MQIDILHFDGHGTYDPDGRLSERSRQAVAAGGAGHLMRDAPAAAGQMGYLLFEDDEAKSAVVPAGLFGDLLQSKQVGLVILSACQSAMVGGEDALGSVAPRLIDAGLPSVLAMTRSVLVATTRALSGYLYHDLAAGRPIGAALDQARAQLYADPVRGEQQRGAGTQKLRLQDWFVPALYQAGADGALLEKSTGAAGPPPAPSHNLREPQESGFHGRTPELWRIERWFVQGTRRIVITGFGGQGKTSLAEEAGRWLLRTGMFDRVCFVTYARFQGLAPVQRMVSKLATVLAANLIDIAAAQAALLAGKTLLILDNLESLDPAARTELLTAATLCTGQGGSRALLTARPDDLVHPDYPTEGSIVCRYLPLDGLAPADALDWYRSLLRLSPERSVPIPEPAAIEALFAQVRFHPLSIRVLTLLSKQQRIADLAEALQARLRQDGDPLRASLNLSLAQLDRDAHAVLPGLGVFVDGALESMLTRVLELDESRWLRLRDGLRQAGLVVLEAIPGIDAAFIRFHPSLAPAMRDQLTPEELARLSERHRAEYYYLSGQLYHVDSRQAGVTRGIARRELPNLLAAVFRSLARGDTDAAEFATKVGQFLGLFGLARDRAALQAQVDRAASSPGSDAWYSSRSSFGEQLFERGQFSAAAAVFLEILRHLGDSPSFRRLAGLVSLARCQREQGQSDSAEALLRGALGDLKTLPASRDIRLKESLIRSDLGNVLTRRGDLGKAQTEYEAGIVIDTELGHDRGVAVGKYQLGIISSKRRDFLRAAQSFLEAIAAFRRLGEPPSIAASLNELGKAYMGAGQLVEAEQALRESAQIKESIGNRLGAARSWANLAIVVTQQGRPVIEVEPLYRKALAVFDAEGYLVGKAMALSNLADLLQSDPARLAEARDLAGRALEIRQTLDPGVAEIWKTYSILAGIAEKQGDTGSARDSRVAARQSYASAPIARDALRHHRPLIGAVLAALDQPGQRPALEPALAQYAAQGSGNLVTSLRALLDGERDEATLCDPLDHGDSLILLTLLRCLGDPAAARAFLAAEG